MKKCPHCSEEILHSAKVCRFCNRKTAKSNIILNMIGLAFVVWLIYGAYERGYLDSFLDKGYSFISIEDTTCEDLQKDAVGIELENADSSSTWEVIGVRNSKEISRNNNELVCVGELLSHGNFSELEMTLSDWDGKYWVEYVAR